jgi:hypothetical protein
MTDGEPLRNFPDPNAADLAAARDYPAANSAEIDRQMREHEEAARLTRIYSNENAPLRLVQRLRALGHDVVTSWREPATQIVAGRIPTSSISRIAGGESL